MGGQSMRRLLAGLLCLLPPAAMAGPQSFQYNLSLPPVVSDSKAAVSCTVAYMIADLSNNDLYAVRMRVASVETDTPTNNRMPCPPDMPPRVAARAMETCANRVDDPKKCVFADMARGFDTRPAVDHTSEIGSRCSSDKFTDIGVACWRSGNLSVCDVGCGNSPAEAQAQAKAHCEEHQQHSCPVTASVPISGP